MSWWDRIFGGAKPAPVPRRHLELSLKDIPTAWRAGGWVPNWSAIHLWLSKNLPQDEHSDAWWALTGSWLNNLQADLGSPYSTFASEHFRVLCPYAHKKATRHQKFLESARSRLARMLGSVAWLQGSGPHVVLFFYDSEEYLTYLANFGGPREEGGSCGVFIRAGYHHIALHDDPIWRMEATLAHELTHNLLARLPIPAWLNEGLAQLAPEELGLTANQMKEIVQEQEQIRECWQRNNLKQFWSGRAFSLSDQRQKRAYQLAEVLTRILLQSPQAKTGFANFVAEADQQDAGESAARQHLGSSLGDWVGQFLGPGEWAPR